MDFNLIISVDIDDLIVLCEVSENNIVTSFLATKELPIQTLLTYRLLSSLKSIQISCAS